MTMLSPTNNPDNAEYAMPGRLLGFNPALRRRATRAGGLGTDSIDCCSAAASLVEPVDQAQAVLAREAFVSLGKGRHKAALNFGNCMTYAKSRRLPVLCKGSDFAATDIEVVRMSSESYSLFVRAMIERTPISCVYRGHRREFCPHILGHGKQGEERSLVFQFAGGTSAGRLRKPDWKCLRLADVSDAALSDGEWVGGDRHTQGQTCVTDVDLDVNPDSPYSPKRRLDELEMR
jgi:hypothetical protein